MGEIQATYLVRLDLRPGVLSDIYVDITKYVASLSIRWGMDTTEQEVARASEAELVLRNVGGVFNPDDPTKPYASRLWRGQRVWIEMTYGGSTEALYIGKVTAREFIETAPDDTGLVRLTLSDQTTRLAASRVNLPIATSVRVDEVVSAVFERSVALWPYDYNYFTIGYSRLGDSPVTPVPRDYENKLLGPTGWATNLSMDAARTTLVWAGDLTGVEVSALDHIREAVAAEAGGRFYWNPKLEVFRFDNRWRDVDYYTPQATLNGTDLERVEGAQDSDLVNEYTVVYRPRRVSNSVTVLYEEVKARRLLTSEVYDVTVRYRDPTAPDAQCAALDPVCVIGTDIEVNTAESGGGTNVTSQLPVTVELNATTARVRIQNTTPSQLWLVQMQIRGKPVTVFDREAVTARDWESIHEQDYAPGGRVIDALDDADIAAAIARVQVRRRTQPARRYSRIRFDATDEAALMALARSVTVGYGVRLEYDEHEKDYVVLGVTHDITAAGTRNDHQVELLLRDVELLPWFIINQSPLGGPDVLAF